MGRKIRLGLLLALGVLVLAGEWPHKPEGYTLEFVGPTPDYPRTSVEADGPDAERAVRDALRKIPGDDVYARAILSSKDGKVREEWRWIGGSWQRTDKPGK